MHKFLKLGNAATIIPYLWLRHHFFPHCVFNDCVLNCISVFPFFLRSAFIKIHSDDLWIHHYSISSHVIRSLIFLHFGEFAERIVGYVFWTLSSWRNRIRGRVVMRKSRCMMIIKKLGMGCWQMTSWVKLVIIFDHQISTRWWCTSRERSWEKLWIIATASITGVPSSNRQLQRSEYDSGLEFKGPKTIPIVTSNQ